MGQVIPDGFGQATLNFDFITGPSNPMAMVFGYINDGAQAPSVNANFIRDSYIQHVMGSIVISNNVAFFGVDVLQNPGGQSGSATANFVGSEGNQSLPPQVAILVKKLTAQGGKKGRGRFYQPGITVVNVSEGGVLGAPAIANLNTAFTNWNTDLGSVSIEMYILHSEALTPPFAVTGFAVDPVVATQRRRIR